MKFCQWLILVVLLKIDLNESWAGIKISIVAHKLPIENIILTKIGADLEILPMYLPLAGMKLKINVTFVHFTSE